MKIAINYEVFVASYVSEKKKKISITQMDWGRITRKKNLADSLPVPIGDVISSADGEQINK